MRRTLCGTVLLVTALATVSACSDTHADECKARGGEVKEVTKVAPSLDGKGGVAVVTTYYCIVDGQIVDIW